MKTRTAILPLVAVGLVLGGIVLVLNAERVPGWSSLPFQADPERRIESRPTVGLPLDIREAGRTVSAGGVPVAVDVAGQAEEGDTPETKGKVVDGAGNCVPNLPLVLIDARGEGRNVQSDAEGRFVFDRAYAPTSARSRSPEWAVERLLGSESGGAFVQVRRPGRIVLSVIDADSTPVPTFVATVVRTDLTTREVQEETSALGTDGVVELVVAAGFMHILLTVPGRLPEWVADAKSHGARSLNVPQAGIVTVEYRLALAERTVTLEVVDAKGGPLAGIAVMPALTIGQLAFCDKLELTTSSGGHVSFRRPDSMRDLELGSYMLVDPPDLKASVRLVQFDERGKARVALGRTPKESPECGELRVAAEANDFTLTTLGPLKLPVDAPLPLAPGESTFVHPGLYRIAGSAWSRTILVKVGMSYFVPTEVANTDATLLVVPDPQARYEAALPVAVRTTGPAGTEYRTLLGHEQLELPCGSADERWELRVGGRITSSVAVFPIVVTGTGTERWQVPTMQRIDVRCLDAAGHPTQGLVVEVRRTDAGWGAIDLVTNDKGTATCFAEGGDYLVSLSGEPGLATTSVALRPGIDEDAYLVMDEEPARIRGQVLGPQLQPLSAAVVIVAALFPSDSQSGARRAMLLSMADEHGRFQTDSLLPGLYRIAVVRDLESLEAPPLVSEEVVLLPGEERSLVLAVGH